MISKDHFLDDIAKRLVGAAPEPPPDDTHLLKRIEDLTNNARAAWFGLLGYLTFVGVTLLGVEDADFFIPSRETQLPLINVSIPTQSFFWIAPVLGAALYIYLQLYLQKLWEALALPAPLKHGERLGARISPWLISDWALKRRDDGADVPRPMGWLAALVSVALVWWAGPVVLFAFWWRSMPAHDEAMTLVIGVSLLAALYAGAAGWWDALSKLRRRAGAADNTPGVRSGLRKTPLALFVLAIVVLSWLRTEGGVDHYANMAIDAAEKFRGRTFAFYRLKDNPKDLSWQEQRENWVRENPWIATAGSVRVPSFPGPIDNWLNLAPADFTDVALTPRPDDWISRETAERRFRADWCKRRDLAADICRPPEQEFERKARNDWCAAKHIPLERTEGGDRQACNAYFTELEHRFAAEWSEQRGEYLETLGAPDLRAEDFRGAVFFRAFLPKADLRGARLEGADLREARLEGVDLTEAWLEGADLSRARLEGAILSGGRLEGANLTLARLEGADLREARLEGANLRSARLEGANLRSARLEGANLRSARLEGALIWGTDLKSADLRAESIAGSALRSVDLTQVSQIGPELLMTAFGDGSVTLPEGVARPGHWPEDELDGIAFYGRWRWWRESQSLPWPPPGRALAFLSGFDAIPPD